MARANTTATSTPPIEGATVVGPGIRISGRVTGEEDLHVEGRIDGAIQLSDTLFVAPGGIVAAEVEAHNVVVSGVIVGNVTARDCVTLHAGAKLVGDITAPRLVIADGAAFKGNVRMGGEPMPARDASARARERGGDKSRVAARPRPVAVRAAARPSAPARAERSAPERTERRPPPPRPRPAEPAAERNEDEDTVIVRHAAVPDDGKPTARAGKGAADKAAKTEAPAKVAAAARPRPGAAATDNSAAKARTDKKLPPRARIPKPGKRRVGRR